MKRNANGGRTLQKSTPMGDKSKHEITPRDYRVTTINVRHSLWG